MAIDMEVLNQYCDDGYNVLFTGKHGVGKTAIIKKLFTDKFGEINEGWKYYSASTLDPWVDFIGIPKDYENKDGDTVFRIVPPESFTGKEQIKAIFFDEINRADEKTLNAIMELIQFRSINGRKFPHLTCIWAAENPADDDDNDYSVRKMDPAQRDRFQIQLRIPYELNKEYMVEKFGNTLFGISNEWWNGGSGERKRVISPRKLDDILAGFVRGYNINDFTTLIPLDELKNNLESVGKFEQIIRIAETHDVVKIKKFFTVNRIRESENLFPTLDPKNKVFNNIYEHLDAEIQKYITKTFGYDYTARDAIVLDDKQLAYINKMSGANKVPFVYANVATVREEMKNVSELFDWKLIFEKNALDSTDLKTIMPFTFNVDDQEADEGKVDLSIALCKEDADFKNFAEFFKMAIAASVVIGKTKGVDVMKESPYYKFFYHLSNLDTRANRHYKISVTQRERLINRLEAGNFSQITKDDFEDDQVFYRK